MAVVPKMSLLGPPLDHKKQFMAPTKKKKKRCCVWGGAGAHRVGLLLLLKDD